MLSLSDPLKARLQALPALAGWDVRCGTELADRRPVPVADVRCAGAQATDSETAAVTLEPTWVLTLAVARSETAAAELDVALAAVVASLHNWCPGRLDGRPWKRLSLRLVREPEFVAEGVAALELLFATSAVYHGAAAGG